jgi:hypothetical protein
VTILDANILIYAYNADAPQHRVIHAWLENLIKGAGSIGLPWQSLWAFLRIATNTRIWPTPKSTEQAFEFVQGWLAQPGVVVVDAGPRHGELLKQLVIEHRAIGPLVSDAVLAALAIENGAILASTDQDFSRFAGLRWTNPLA